MSQNKKLHFKIEHFEILTSTNTAVNDRAAKGAAEGLVIVADYQSEGRGKPGNTWRSEPGKDLLFSILLRPNIATNQAPLLTQISCRSVAKVLTNHYGLSPTLKKPNDVLVEGEKICGILVETSSVSSGKLNHIVLGIGLNVNSSRTELLPTATSLACELGRNVEKEPLLNQLLEQLNEDIPSLDAPTT